MDFFKVFIMYFLTSTGQQNIVMSWLNAHEWWLFSIKKSFNNYKVTQSWPQQTKYQRVSTLLLYLHPEGVFRIEWYNFLCHSFVTIIGFFTNHMCIALYLHVCEHVHLKNHCVHSIHLYLGRAILGVTFPMMLSGVHW